MTNDSKNKIIDRTIEFLNNPDKSNRIAAALIEELKLVRSIPIQSMEVIQISPEAFPMPAGLVVHVCNDVNHAQAVSSTGFCTACGTVDLSLPMLGGDGWLPISVETRVNVSPNNCPVCSPGPWGNQIAPQILPDVQVCNKCGHEHRFNSRITGVITKTKEEAIEAMKAGAKVAHRFFGKNEWITMEGNLTIVTEEGYAVSTAEFWSIRNSVQWDTDWSIWSRQ